jgi:hypothetical protein
MAMAGAVQRTPFLMGQKASRRGSGGAAVHTRCCAGGSDCRVGAGLTGGWRSSKEPMVCWRISAPICHRPPPGCCRPVCPSSRSQHGRPTNSLRSVEVQNLLTRALPPSLETCDDNERPPRLRPEPERQTHTCLPATDPRRSVRLLATSPRFPPVGTACSRRPGATGGGRHPGRRWIGAMRGTATSDGAERLAGFVRSVDPHESDCSGHRVD